MKKNQLSRAEFFKVGQWLTSNGRVEAFRTAKTSLADIARVAAKELGFEINAENLKSVGKSLELDLPTTHTSTVVSRIATNVSRMELEIRELDRRLKAIEEHLTSQSQPVSQSVQANTHRHAPR